MVAVKTLTAQSFRRRRENGVRRSARLAAKAPDELDNGVAEGRGPTLFSSEIVVNHYINWREMRNDNDSKCLNESNGYFLAELLSFDSLSFACRKLILLRFLDWFTL
ncbi:hypothetical protein CEXT_369941 [Caerostris extrusa]|uniref:Uncharacterized protein n=1 Tax=Caerostris extrusa TaxID=172846 RepID=A0AAV4UP70_CAEEX|nr:hypothetical protein CEXT_369941 [Caerostris extrusa]